MDLVPESPTNIGSSCDNSTISSDNDLENQISSPLTTPMVPIPQSTLRSFHNFITSSKCKTILALAGAGLSAGSGLPTFRGSGGYWKNYSSIDLATPDAFHNDPGLVWQFYSYRRHQALQASPNDGHFSLSKLSNLTIKPKVEDNDNQKPKKLNFLTITQNIDGLSQRAGHNPNKLLEFHGSLFELRCTNFDCSYIEKDNFDDPLTAKLKQPADFSVSPGSSPLPYIEETYLPHCPRCEEGLLRPGVVWFGESLPLQLIDKADEFIMRHRVDLILVIGTSRVVWPAASYVDIVKERGGKVAIFNTEVDEEEDVTVDAEDSWQFIGDCAETLPIALKPLIGDI